MFLSGMTHIEKINAEAMSIITGAIKYPRIMLMTLSPTLMIFFLTVDSEVLR